MMLIDIKMMKFMYFLFRGHILQYGSVYQLRCGLSNLRSSNTTYSNFEVIRVSQVLDVCLGRL